MKEFLFPTSFIWDKDTYSDNYGLVIIQPLERGYGVTLGNLYRRVLLSSIPGIAITSLRIDGVLHEFSNIEGVKEDVVEIVLNLKNVALKPIISEFPHKISVEIENKDEIVAGDLFSDGSVDAINKELHIATVDPAKKYKIEIEITKGFGYLPVEKMKLIVGEIPIGTILIDGIYSPIKKVSFRVENTMVGQSVDYEKLILEIRTTGAIPPKDALIYATDIILKHLNLIKNKQIIEGKEGKEEEKKEYVKEDTDIPISELNLSTRALNALNGKNIKTIKELINTPKEDIEELKNLGKKSIEEIEDALKKRGYKLLTLEEIAKKEEENET